MAKSALLIVDVQNDFLPKGALPVPHGDQVIAPINRLIKRAKEAESLILTSQDWHPRNTPHFEKWPVHCVQGTLGASFPEELKVDLNMFRIFKGRGVGDGYSALAEEAHIFGFGPDLSGRPVVKFLKDWSVQQILVCGLATEYCVKATVLDALKLGFKVAVLLDGIRAVNPGGGFRALAEMADAGAEFVLLSQYPPEEEED